MAKAKTVKLISSEARVYPTLGLACDAGEIVELDRDPGIHGLWLLDDDGHAVIPEVAQHDPDGGDTGTDDDDQGQGDPADPDASTSSPDPASGSTASGQNPGEGA